MNERIKHLFKQAGGKTSARNLASNPVQVVETHELWDDRIEKFAELIVAECLDQIECQRSSGENSDQWTITKDMCYHNMMAVLKQHFGVEE